MSSATATFDQLCAHAREVALLTSTQSLLEWDERTKMPPAGGAYRAEQVSYLAGLIHKRQTQPEVGEWLRELAGSELANNIHGDTGAGLGAKGEGRRNFEMGILTDDDVLLDAAQARFERIWSGAECRGCRLKSVCPAPLDARRVDRPAPRPNAATSSCSTGRRR